MKINIILLFILVIQGCSTFNTYNNTPCENFKLDIKRDWIQLNDTLYQIAGEPDFLQPETIMKYLPKPCLYGKSSQFLTEVYGNPSFIYEDNSIPNSGKWIGYYYRHKSDLSHYDKRKFYFYFNENDSLVNIDGWPMNVDRWNIYN